MRVMFHGVRGSTPVCGHEFVETGGSTSCLSVAVGDDPPALVLDAGTGLLGLARHLGGQPFRGAIVLTHLHWDHFHGLPFFGPADRDDADVDLLLPAQGDPVEVLERGMSPPHFPIGPLGLRGAWTYRGIEPGEHAVRGFELTAAEVEHKGGRTFGYRVEHGGASLAYVPDALDDNDDAIIGLVDGVDLLIRGAPFVADEQGRADLFGHGTVERAIAVAERARVGTLVVTHHSPHRTDEQIRRMSVDFGVVMATEGLVVDVGAIAR